MTDYSEIFETITDNIQDAALNWDEDAVEVDYGRDGSFTFTQDYEFQGEAKLLGVKLEGKLRRQNASRRNELKAAVEALGVKVWY